MAARKYSDIPPPSNLLERVTAEIEQRMQELRPAVVEREQLLQAAAALGLGAEVEAYAGAGTVRRRRGRPPGSGARAVDGTGAGADAGTRRRPGRPPGPASAKGATQQAIVDALEHGSHTLSELVVVTALPAPAIRKQIAALLDRRMVTRARREGKSAYALARPSA